MVYLIYVCYKYHSPEYQYLMTDYKNMWYTAIECIRLYSVSYFSVASLLFAISTSVISKVKVCSESGWLASRVTVLPSISVI